MTFKHVYKDAIYETQLDVLEGLYYVWFNGGVVTGTHSKSRGEASMRFILWLESMLDQETKPLAMGDLIILGDKIGTVAGFSGFDTEEPILELALKDLEIRSFLGPSSADAFDQLPVIKDIQGEYMQLPANCKFQWEGTNESFFLAYANENSEVLFEYSKEVNIWVYIPC